MNNTICSHSVMLEGVRCVKFDKVRVEFCPARSCSTVHSTVEFDKARADLSAAAFANIVGSLLMRSDRKVTERKIVT